MRRILAVLMVLLLPTLAEAGTYWVSPAGTATWVNCQSATPLSGTAACSLDTANGSLVAGDTVYLRGGTYTTHIHPSNSGTALDRISYRGYTGETAIIHNTTTSLATYYHGISLDGQDYITIANVTIDNPLGEVPSMKDRPFMIENGSDHNEIADCEIDGNGGGNVQMWRGSYDNPPVTHNWIHGCYIHHTGGLWWDGYSVDDGGGMQVGIPAYDDASGYNTIEDNEFYCGGHHNLETFTKYNVIRNNYFHNEGCMSNPTGHDTIYGPDSNSLWGNRNLQIYDGLSADGMFNLVEGNRFGPSGPPPDDDGGDGLTITAPKNIIRYNSVYGAQNNGVLFKLGSGSLSNYNRFYNNTIYASGRFDNTGGVWQGTNIRWYRSSEEWPIGNVLLNNILYSYGSGGADWYSEREAIWTDNAVSYNYCTDARSGACVANGNPLFTSTTYDAFAFSKTDPNLTLQSGSPARNAGRYLTTTTASGTSSTTLAVVDALFFQDGTLGSPLDAVVADWVAVGTVSNVAQISAVSYATNTITLASPLSWSNGASVWLYKKSDGVVVLSETGPDIGANEYGATTPPSAPTGVRIR